MTPQSPANIFKVSGNPETGHHPVCYRHHGTPADATCFTCLKAICRVCTLQDFEGAQCVTCAAKKRNTKKARTLGLLVSGVVAGGVGIALMQNVELPYDYGASTREVRQLQGQLDKTPCDKRDVLRLAELMLKEGNEPGVILQAQDFFTACGDWPRLRWVTYEAHKRAGQHDAAIAEATRLIDNGPQDKDFRWWRGMAHELKGDHASAAVDYAQAIALQPALSNIPFNLSSMLELLARPCDALRPLEQYLALHQEHQEDEEVLLRLHRLHTACPAARGVGSAEIPRDADNALRTEVKLGTGSVKMTVDSSSAYVAITAARAGALGITPTGAEMILASAAGALKGRIASVPTIRVGDAVARNVDVAVVDSLPQNQDGLLGLSFLARFDRSVEMVPCRKGECAAMVLEEQDSWEDE